MPKKIQCTTKADLISVALPQHGATYTVISHQFVMDYATQQLNAAGFSIVDEEYRCTADGQIAQGIYRLNYNNDPELSMMFAWTNSYNKQVKFKCLVGAYINKTNSVMICGDLGSWTRKHTGSADTETKETIDDYIQNANMYYDQLVADKATMETVMLNRRKQSQLLGVLFAEYEILTTEQASMVRDQMKKPQHVFQSSDSLWAFYNYVTIALQKSHPKTWMEDQRILHYFITSLPNFQTNPRPQVVAPVVEETTNEATVPFVDPRQIDLEDSIAEVLAEEAEKASLENNEIEMVQDEEPEEEAAPVYCEDRIREQIAEDEAAVAAVCDPDDSEDDDEIYTQQEETTKDDSFEYAEEDNFSLDFSESTEDQDSTPDFF